MSKHVLIVEDDTLLADMMEKILRKYGVRVGVAYNGQEALSAMEKEVPDVLLLDLLLPVLDGHDVMQVMKQREIACPVIVLTNLSDKKTKSKCAHEGLVKEYFVKNELDDDALWPAVEKYLR